MECIKCGKKLKKFDEKDPNADPFCTKKCKKQAEKETKETEEFNEYKEESQ